LTVMPSWFRMAPGPLPCEFCVNIPGAVAAVVNWNALEVWFEYSIHTPGLTTAAISYGSHHRHLRAAGRKSWERGCH